MWNSYELTKSEPWSKAHLAPTTYEPLAVRPLPSYLTLYVHRILGLWNIYAWAETERGEEAAVRAYQTMITATTTSVQLIATLELNL